MRRLRWNNLKRRLRKLVPGPIRREVRTRAAALGSTPALPFADISNNNAVTPAMIAEYAQHHTVLAVKTSEGATWRDPKAAEFIQAAKEAGLLIMPYHYARPDNGNRPEDEAHNFVHACRRAGLRMGPRRKLWYERTELPGVLDYEEYARNGKDAEWISRFIREYRRLTKHGTARWRGVRDPVTEGCIVYGGHVVRERIPGRIDAIYWLAAYTKSAAPFWPYGLPARYRFAWQFTDRGRFKAFGDRDIDRNRFVGKLTLRDIIGLAT